MIAALEASFPLPSDGNTVAIIMLVLVFLGRELWDLLKKKAETERAAEVGAVAKLEAKIDSLASDVRANLRELSTAQANQHADLMVLAQRTTTTELEVGKLRDAFHKLANEVQPALLKRKEEA